MAAWEEYLRVAGAPVDTIGLRTYHLQRVALELEATPGTLTYEALSGWLAGQRWKPNTRRSYRSSLRAFYAWAMATGRVQESPAHLLPPVKVPRGKPRPTPETAYRSALGVDDERVRLAILLGGACGLRRGEVARLRGEDLEQDLLGHSLRITGKGGHVRLVPIPVEVARMILGRTGWLFPSSQGGHLTPAYLAKMVRAQLGHSMHTLRHRCGTTAYAATHDLRAVQELLGHAKPETTALYTQVPTASIRAAMDAAAG